MTNEQVTAYLQDDSYLYTLSYEEIKTLVVQYPYASNLRVLLLKKSHIEQHKDYERNLQMASTYTTNRKHLYKLIRNLKPLSQATQNVVLGENYLELAPLSHIEKIKPERQRIDLGVKSSDNTTATSNDIFDFAMDNEVIPSAAQFPKVETPFLEPNFIQNTDNQSIINHQNTEGVLENDSLNTEHSPSNSLKEETINDGDIPKNESFNDPIVLDPEWVFLVHSIAEEYKDFKPNAEIDTVNSEIVLSERAEIESEFIPNVPETVKTELTPLEQKKLSETSSSPNFEFRHIDNLIQLSQDSSLSKSFFEENNKIFSFDTSHSTQNISFIEEESSRDIIDLDDTESTNFEDLGEPIILDLTPQSPAEKDTTSIEYYEPLEAILNDTHKEVPPVALIEPQKEAVEVVQNIELVIVNEAKTKIIESQTPKSSPSTMSFTEWLRQFKGASSVVTTQPEPIENDTEKTDDITTIEQSLNQNFVKQQIESIDNQSITNDENMRLINQERIEEIFDTESQTPDNLFGLYKEDKKTPQPQATFELETEQNALSDDNFVIQTPFLPFNTEGDKLSEDDSFTDEFLEDDEALEEEKSKEKKKKKKKKKRDMHHLAAKSLEEDEDLVSETLAQILALQGHRKEAIAMYAKLILLFPEKSDYFAAKIEKLRI